MKDSKNIISLIDHYLSGEMSGSERAVFEKRLDEDKNFADIYENMLNLKEGIRANAINERLTYLKKLEQEISNPKKNWFLKKGRWWTLVLSSVFLLGIILLLFVQFGGNNVKSENQSYEEIFDEGITSTAIESNDKTVLTGEIKEVKENQNNNTISSKLDKKTINNDTLEHFPIASIKKDYADNLIDFKEEVLDSSDILKEIDSPISIDFTTLGNLFDRETFEFVIASSSNDQNVKFEWDFGNNEKRIVSSRQLKYIYPYPGTYQVKLCVWKTDSCVTKEIKVLSQSSVSFNPHELIDFDCPFSAKISDTILFTPSDFPINLIQQSSWDFGDGTQLNIPGDTSVQHSYSTPGMYNVTYCVNQNQFCTKKLIFISETGTVNKVNNFDDGFTDLKAESTVGLRAFQICNKEKTEFHQKNIYIKLYPKQDIILKELKIHTSSTLKVSFIIYNEHGDHISNKLNYIPDLKFNTVDLMQMEANLYAGNAYWLHICSEVPYNGLFLSNSTRCNPEILSNDILEIDYGGNLVIYDLKVLH